jgi:hypothetical protein
MSVRIVCKKILAKTRNVKCEYQLIFPKNTFTILAARAFTVTTTQMSHQSSPADSDPRDHAVVWLHHVWDDGAPRSWGSVGWMHVCGTGQGALNAAAQLTKWVTPLGDHAHILAHMQALHPTPPLGKVDTTPFSEVVIQWASLMKQTFLIVEDRGGGHVGGVWKASASTPFQEAQVTLREARRTFREHGVIIAIDVNEHKTVSLLYEPDVKDRLGLSNLLSFSVDDAVKARLKIPRAAPPAAPAAPVAPVDDQGMLRAQRAIYASAAAIAAAN